MRQSVVFTKTSKNAPKDETSLNAQLLIKAGYVDKLMAGVYSLLPFGKRVVDNIIEILQDELNALGAQQIKMPALTPKEAWVTTGRWDAMDVLFKLENDNQSYALGSTHEEVVTPLVKKFIHSYRDLPIAVYQIQDKFRNEARAKSGMLRGREFTMKDLYSFHATEEDLDQYYDKVTETYNKIFQRCGLNAKLVEASGGVFSKLSHEFQVFTEFGEDTIFECTTCQKYRNKEIVFTDFCSDCATPLVKHKAIEVGNIFKLYQRFSDPFKVTYLDKVGKQQLVVMGCYGIGVTRLMGAIIEVSHDDKGIIWPESVSPFQFHLLNLNKDSVQADVIYETLQKRGFEVLYDDRSVSAGVKLNDADLIGITKRLVVGAKTEGKIEYKLRSSTASELISLEEIIQRHV